MSEKSLKEAIRQEVLRSKSFVEFMEDIDSVGKPKSIDKVVRDIMDEIGRKFRLTSKKLNSKIANLVNEGTDKAFGGDYKGAIRNFNKVIDIDPKCVVAYLNRGNAWSCLGDWAQALFDFNKVLALDPCYAVAYIDRGITMIELGKLESAIDDYDKAIDLNPPPEELWVAYLNRSTAKKSLGDTKGASLDYNKSLELKAKIESPQ